jgi:hypothetical protein
MVSHSETEEILQGAVSGVARVALAIAAIPTEHRKQALLAAERSYLQSTLALGYGEAAARKWVSAVMLRLQVEVEGVGSEPKLHTTENSAGHETKGNHGESANGTGMDARDRLSVELEMSKLVEKTYVRAMPEDSFSHEVASEGWRGSENDFDAPLNKLAKLLHADGAISDKELKATLGTRHISQGSNSSDGDDRRDGLTKSLTSMRPVQAIWRIVKFPFDWRGYRRP